MKKLMLALLATAFVAVGTQAYAFDGTVIFGSSDGKSNVTVTNKKGSTTVAFGANWVVEPGGSGAYTGTGGAAVSYTNFTYTTGTGVITSPGATFTLWSFVSGTHTYTFDLNSPVVQGVNTGTVFQVSGTGTAFIDGADPSAGTWSLTGTSSGASFKFVSSSVTAVVPDGGSAVALLGIALAGIEGLRRKIGARKA
jgi:hypothetical protein